MQDEKIHPLVEHKRLKKDKMSTGMLGYAEDMDDKQLSGKVIDTVSGLVFETKEAYRKHISPIDGKRADSLEHLPAHFSKISEAALARGAKRKTGKVKKEK